MALFSRRACTSWRFVTVEGHKDHLPGDCAKCWVACRNVIAKDEWAVGIRRCADCADSLVHCPILQVRKTLVEEQGISDDVLTALVTDSYGPVSMKARRLLDERIAARTPEPDFITIPIELEIGPRRAHRQQRALAAASTSSQPALVGQRVSVWDQ